MIIVKENEQDEGFQLDKTDCSIVRSIAMHKEIFDKADLKIIDVITQPDFPPELIPVRLYALQ